MKSTLFTSVSGVAAAALLTGLGMASAVRAADALVPVTGDYVEARSASVYAGGCHFNGEVTTVGREAMLAWKFSAGTVGGVRLEGLRAVALVVGGENLAEANTTRRSVLLIDETATPAQRDAIVTLLKTRLAKTLGVVTAVKSAPIRFTAEGKNLTVTAGEANLSAEKYPCAHCLMPAQTWYAPFAPIKDAMVAQGVTTGFADKTLGVSWSQSSSDNVFFGTFAL